MRLAWTRMAAADRREIRDWVARDNPAAALALDELFSVKAEGLLQMPNMGRQGRLGGTRELVVHKRYVLVYDVQGEVVRILRIMHTRRQWPLQE